MFKRPRFNRAWFILLVCLVFAGFLSAPAWALTVGETYTITLYKVNGDGTTSSVSSTTVTADVNGKISFTLSNVPTSPTNNFIVFEVTDSSGTIVRRGFSPAPPAGSENLTGINTLSTSQTDAILKAGEVAGTDDPILVAFGLILTRSPGISSSDIESIATLGNAAIRGDGGFESFLLSNGVSSAQLDTLRNKLVYNGASGAKDLGDFTAKFKTAVDNDDDSDMAKAGGYMAEIFVDAANAAGIEPGLILAAHDAAGEVTFKQENAQLIATMSSAVQNAMNRSMSSFFTRIAAMKLEAEYTDALTTLGASGAQVDTYNSAVQTMITAFENIDATYGDYFMDPDTYVAENNTTHNAVQQAIDTAFQNAFSQFQTDIRTSNAGITSMKDNVAAALNINVGDLPDGFGQMWDFDGNQVNWPIPQTVMVNWLADIIAAGGELTYTRDTIEIPTNITWIGTCSDSNYYDKESCESNAGTWTSERHVFNGFDSSFDAFRGLQEDIMIIEFARYATFDAAQQQNLSEEEMKAAEKDARLLFQQRLDSARGRIGGTTDGTTAISTAQRKAMIKLIQQPSLH